MSLATCLKTVYRMNEWVNKWMNEWVNKWMNELGKRWVDFCRKYNKGSAVTITGGKFCNTLRNIVASQDSFTSSSYLDWHFSVTKYEYSSKAFTVEAWKGTGGSRSLRLPGFKTIGIWRWQSSLPMYRPHLPPGNFRGILLFWRLSRHQDP